MGIDIEVYRLRIGAFNRYRRNTGEKQECGGDEELIWGLGVILAILLIIGGVELNPGPPKKSVKTSQMLNSELIKEELNELRNEINEINQTLNDLVPPLQEFRTSISAISKNLQTLQQDNNRLQVKINNLELQQRRKNIIIFGLEEERREHRLETYNSVFQLCIEKFGLNIDGSHIEDAYRIGRGKSRPVLVKCVSVATKELILNRRRSLRGSKIWLENDYSMETRTKRKLLVPYLQEARKRRQFAVLAFDKLKINGKSYDLDYCQKNFKSHNNWILNTRSEQTQGDDFSTEQRNNTGGKNARQSADYDKRCNRQQPSVCGQNANRSTSKQLLPEIDAQGTLRSDSTDRGKRIYQESSRRESVTSPEGSCQNPGPSTADGFLEQVSLRRNDFMKELRNIKKKTGKIDDLFIKLKK